jgi:hypothetical protein
LTEFVPPSTALQVDFFFRLQAMRNEVLLDALLQVLGKADPQTLDKELHQFVKEERLQTMKSYGLAAELAFVTPYLLKLKPRLIGYYRLLLGLSQKEFYSQGGFNLFTTMETNDVLSGKQETQTPGLCRALNEASWNLISGIGQKLTTENIKELTLLTLGPQFRGGRNTRIGSAADTKVFEIFRDAVKFASPTVTGRLISVKGKSGNEIVIQFGSDPDVRIEERKPGCRKILAAEIKGGTDVSNLHNRLGEAEKSHLKAKKEGFPECWTILHFKGFDLAKARSESPTTDLFYDIVKIADLQSKMGQDFQKRLCMALGL